MPVRRLRSRGSDLALRSGELAIRFPRFTRVMEGGRTVLATGATLWNT